MRSCNLWRDINNRIYAEDSKTGERFTFLDYAAAVTDKPALQQIVANEMLSDLQDFGDWLNGQEPSFLFSIPSTSSSDN